MAGAASSNRQRSKIAPYLMILPALAYLAIFFVVPFWSLFRASLSTSGFSQIDLITDTGDPLADLTAAAKWLIRGVTTPEIAALHRLTIAELTHHPELQRSWRDDERGQSLIAAVAAYLADCDRRGTLTVPDPQTAARQFVWLASVEAQIRSLRGIEPLSSREVSSIARDTATLIVRAHQPK